jgi:predicted transcriptional regulator
VPATDAAAFLANSPERLALLRSLADGPASPGDLAATGDRSRRSVQRNLAAFAERGWVETTGGTYRLTAVGDLVAERHATYVDTLARIERFAPFYRHLDPDHAPDPDALAGARLTVATEADPQAPVHEYVDRVESLDAGRVRMLSPVLSRLFHEAHAPLAARGVYTDLVMPAPVVERARERNPAEFAAVVGSDVLSLRRTAESFRLGLTLADDRVLAAAYDEDRRLRALVASGNDALYDWAADLFERYREAADPVETADG